MFKFVLNKTHPRAHFEIVFLKMEEYFCYCDIIIVGAQAGRRSTDSKVTAGQQTITKLYVTYMFYVPQHTEMETDRVQTSQNEISPLFLGRHNFNLTNRCG